MIDAVDLPATAQPRMSADAQTRRRNCVKLGMPRFLDAIGCVSRRGSEQCTPLGTLKAIVWIKEDRKDEDDGGEDEQP